MLQTSPSQLFPTHYYAVYSRNRNGKLLVNLPFVRRRELLESLLAAPKDPVRLSPLLQTSPEQILVAVRELGSGRCRGQMGGFHLANELENPARPSSDVSSRRFRFPRAWGSTVTFASGSTCCALAIEPLVSSLLPEFLGSSNILVTSIAKSAPATPDRTPSGAILLSLRLLSTGGSRLLFLGGAPND